MFSMLLTTLLHNADIALIQLPLIQQKSTYILFLETYQVTRRYR